MLDAKFGHLGKIECTRKPIGAFVVVVDPPEADARESRANEHREHDHLERSPKEPPYPLEYGDEENPTQHTPHLPSRFPQRGLRLFALIHGVSPLFDERYRQTTLCLASYGLFCFLQEYLLHVKKRPRYVKKYKVEDGPPLQGLTLNSNS